MLMRQVLECLFQSRRVVQQVDHHVEAVEDTYAVGGKLGAVWMFNVDALERLSHFRILLSQPSDQPRGDNVAFYRV